MTHLTPTFAPPLARMLAPYRPALPVAASSISSESYSDGRMLQIPPNPQKFQKPGEMTRIPRAGICPDEAVANYMDLEMLMPVAPLTWIKSR